MIVEVFEGCLLEVYPDRGVFWSDLTFGKYFRIVRSGPYYSEAEALSLSKYKVLEWQIEQCLDAYLLIHGECIVAQNTTAEHKYGSLFGVALKCFLQLHFFPNLEMLSHLTTQWCQARLNQIGDFWYVWESCGTFFYYDLGNYQVQLLKLEDRFYPAQRQFLLPDQRKS